MSWLKNNGIWLLVLVMIGMLVFKSFSNNRKGIDPEVQNKLDSVNTVIIEKSVENKYLLKEKNDLEKEKQEILKGIKDKLKQIQPNYNKALSDYRQAPPEQKKIIVNSEFERRKNEMNSEQKNWKNK